MLRLALASGVAGLLLALPARAAEPPVRMPTKKQLKACPAFADVDMKAIYLGSGRGNPAWRAQTDRKHVETRGPFGAFEAPADAKVALRIWAGATGHQEVRTDTSSIVWLGTDDVWRVNRVDYFHYRPISPKPPQAPDEKGVSPPYVGWTAQELERMMREERVGVLAPDRAAGIEMALADPCFRLQPDHMPFDVPVKKGKPPRAPCWGVTGGTIEIRWADGRRRDVTELCGGFYAGGLIQAVMYARPYAEDAETKAACDPLRAQPRSALAPAARRELAFCEAGLSSTLRERRLGDAARDALARDARRLTPAQMMQRYRYLSEWSAAALRKALERAGSGG